MTDDDGVVELGGRQRYSEEVGRRVRELLSVGVPIREIGRQLRVSSSTVTWWIERHHLRTPAHLVPPEPPKVRLAATPAAPKRTLRSDRILRKALSAGVSRSHAAAAAGWTPMQLERAVAADEQLERLVLEAERKCQEVALTVIREAAAEKNWLPAAWLLERRFGFVRTAEIPLAERDRLARAIGAQLVDRLVAGFGELGLSPDQQEVLRVRLSGELEKAAGSV